MRSTTWLGTGALLLTAVACSGRAPEHGAANADLERDLAKVSATSLQLASEARRFQPTTVVSDLEQTDGAIPIQRKKLPKPVVHDQTARQPEQLKAPDAVPQDVVAQPEEPQPAPESAATDDDVPRVPSVAPRPAPIPVDVPSEEGGGNGRSRGAEGGRTPDIPTVIGILIQGVGRGDDHCVPHSGPRPRGPGVRIPFPNN